MHIAIDLRIADAPGMEMTGAGRYALETARAVHEARPTWRLSLFSNRAELLRWASSPSTSVVPTRLATARATIRVAWLHSAAAMPTLRLKPDVWFSPSFVLPVWWRGPSVVTVHDLTFLLMPERYRGTLNSWYASAATRHSARRADRVLCGSRATLEALVTHFGIDPGRIAVIPYGVADTFFAAGEADVEQAADGASYVLFVGTREARKGLSTLYDAVRSVNADGNRLRLVLAGQDGWGTEQLMRDIRRDPSVELVDRPTDDDLARLYRGAVGLAYPSEMEGFGLPVAEAMACGCPVIASHLPSIREFAGDHPLYITPGDTAALAGQIERLLGEGPEELAERRRAGREAVASLRWSALGEKTAETIEQVAGKVS